MKRFIFTALAVLSFTQVPLSHAETLNPLAEAATLGMGKGMDIYNNVTTKPPTNTAVPGYSGSSQPQQTYYSGGQGDLVSPGVGRSSGCASAGDPECLAVNLLNWGPNNRVLPPLNPNDPLIKGPRSIYNDPNATLGSFGNPENNTAGQIGSNIQVCETVNTNVPAEYLDQICNDSVQIDIKSCNSVRVIDLDPWTTYRCLKVNFEIEAKTCRVDQIVEVRADHDYRCERTTQVKKDMSCKKFLSVTCEQPQPDGCQTGGIVPGSTQGDMLTSFNHIGGGTYQLQFGTIADNYWSGWGAKFDRTLDFQVANVDEITQFNLVRAAFDDWLLVQINNQVVYVGAKGGKMLDTYYTCPNGLATCLTPNNPAAYAKLIANWNELGDLIGVGSSSDNYCGGKIVRIPGGWSFQAPSTPYFEWTLGTEPKIVAAQSPELKACAEIELGFSYIPEDTTGNFVVTNGISTYNVEQNTSWDISLNIDMKKYLVNGKNRINTRTIVGNVGESAIQINARMACPFVCRDEWINGCAALEARQ